MSAVEALRLARESGVRLDVAGADLILDADREPAPGVLEAIRRHKAGIVALLAAAEGDWTVEAWVDHFEERAAIIQHDGGLPRPKAEWLAFSDTINQWLIMHPPPATDDSDGCVHCGADLGEDGVPVLAGGAHTWIHSQCHHAWLTERRRHAAEKLSAMGIRTMRR